MTATYIEKLIKEGEGFTVEFKECSNALNNSVFETVCSFSNRYGGHLLLGVCDSGEIRGVNPERVNEIKNNFVNVLNNPNKISPTLMLSLTEVDVKGKIVLYVYVPPTSQVQFCSGRIFDRNFESDINITNSGELAAQLISGKSGQFTERRLFPYATFDDMRLDLIPAVKRLALSHNSKHPWKDMTDDEFFRSAGLYEEDKMSGKKGFNLAGILLLGNDDVIQSCAPGYATDCIVRRENLNRYDDRLIVETNLIEAYDKIFEFIEKHTLDRFFIIGNQNVSIRSRIAREIVSNSLAHREYSSSYRSRVVIEREQIVTDNWSRPQFDGRIDPNAFTPRSKNPLIAKFFVNIGRADELGSGVRNLYEYTRIYSGGEPELLEGNIFKTIIPMATMGTDLKVDLKVEQQTLNRTLIERRVLDVLKANPEATLQDVAKHTEQTLYAIKNAVQKLQSIGCLKREGAKKKGLWVVNESNLERMADE